jgi:hypothetical protein
LDAAAYLKWNLNRESPGNFLIPQFLHSRRTQNDQNEY